MLPNKLSEPYSCRRMTPLLVCKYNNVVDMRKETTLCKKGFCSVEK